MSFEPTSATARCVDMSGVQLAEIIVQKGSWIRSTTVMQDVANHVSKPGRRLRIILPEGTLLDGGAVSPGLSWRELLSYSD